MPFIGLMPSGFMPSSQSRLLDLGGQIWHILVLLLLSALLRSPELSQTRLLKPGISANKATFWSLSTPVLWRGAGWGLPLASVELPRRKTIKLALGSGFFNKHVYLQIDWEEAEEQLLACRGGEEERLRRLLGFFDSLPLACRGGEGGRRVVIPAPASILYLTDNHLELKGGWGGGSSSARHRQGDGDLAKEGWPSRPSRAPPYAADLRAHHAAAKFAVAFFSDQGQGQFKRHDGAFFNLQLGGPLPRASPEFTSVCCQVVCPRRYTGGRSWKLSAGGGMRGPDRVSFSLSRVLVANCQYEFVISFHFWVWLVSFPHRF